jgi:hypothetical protein
VCFRYLNWFSHMTITRKGNENDTSYSSSRSFGAGMVIPAKWSVTEEFASLRYVVSVGETGLC